VRDVSPDYFTLEALVGLAPDFLFAGWNYGLSVGTAFLPLSYDEATPGPRNAEAVTAIAEWLHPSAFGLPSDGS